MNAHEKARSAALAAVHGKHAFLLVPDIFDTALSAYLAAIDGEAAGYVADEDFRDSAAQIDVLQMKVGELESELQHFSKSGIVEIAVRNPSVADYMAHWEGRADKAEAEAKQFRKMVEDIIEAVRNTRQEPGVANIVERKQLRELETLLRNRLATLIAKHSPEREGHTAVQTTKENGNG